MTASVISLENVGVRYVVPRERVPTFKEFAIQRVLRGQTELQEFWALKDLNLTIKQGEVLGIVGSNGAGKSTLLKVIARMISPTTGRVRVWGELAPLLDLGIGFDAELTGRENIFLYGALLGHSQAYLRSHFESIVHFAGIDRFIDAPLRTYSNGMIVRLAFALATQTVPEILLLDEILSVGDKDFAAASLERIQTLIAQGTTVLFVSHASDLIARFCTRAIWLDAGTIKVEGEPTAVLSTYYH